MNNNKRKVQRYVDKIWEDVELMDVSPGDVIRMFESDDKPVLYEGQTIYQICSTPYLNDNGIATVEVTT